MITNKHNLYLTSVASVHEVFIGKGPGTQVLYKRTQVESMSKSRYTLKGPGGARSVARRRRHEC